MVDLLCALCVYLIIQLLALTFG